ncbi:histidine kinase [Actinomadura sp. NEAU-AAG7]|uniref:histidine kinase n=1 Tax=Actinomadura sp. NEAU-AAG7 TaxID=2839640 RepID=UPI001BE480A1|nr:histidine kinase [Actinomadura sp. NEAU-AAG7]MBT2213791.1 sensor histidine kinase [Actinomadura sp. NEAU-AAG7]
MKILRPVTWRGPLLDAGVALAVGAVTTIMIHESDEQHARPVDAGAYLVCALMTLPLVLHRRKPVATLLLSSAGLFVYYSLGYPGIPPTALLAVPFFSTVYAGRPRWAVGVCAGYFTVGFVIFSLKHGKPLEALANFLTHTALAVTVMLLAEVLRSRRALAAETRERLRLAAEEREAEAARRVAEDRVRIARELHDTVAHSMATITVQAGSALHVLGEEDEGARPALAAIRETSKQALREMRATLGALRSGADADTHGLDRLPALLEAVRASGVPVELAVTGTVRDLGQRADHAAYRILQESLTNVLRHAGTDVRVRVRVAYDDAGLDLEIVDDGGGPAAGAGGGHGVNGMRERVQALGGTFAAGAGASGGFRVAASLPAARAPLADVAGGVP